MIARAGDLVANRFEVIGTAGAGGMGTVYQARDRHSGQLCALKLLHAHEADAEYPARFHREAEILAELRHPGIVSYVAHGVTASGQPFLAMEWLDGEDLAQRLARGGLSRAQTYLLIQRVAEALAFAHSLDILHRERSAKNKICRRHNHVALHQRRTNHVALRTAAFRTRGWRPGALARNISLC
jgi:serine/threonine protein kinase